MAAALILWTDDAGATAFIQFDVVETESHEATVEVTSFPVEEGADMSDHARPVPETLTLEGFVSNKPLPSNPGVNQIGRYQQVSLEYRQQQSRGSARVPVDYPVDPPTPLNFNGLGKKLRSLLSPRPTSYQGSAPRAGATVHQSAQLFAFDQGFVNRCRAIAEKLEDCRLKARRLRVQTTLRDYEDMMLVREAEPRTADTGGGIIFQIDLKRIRTVRSQTVDAPAPVEARGAAKVNTGSKQGKPDPNAEPKKEKLESSSHRAKRAVVAAFSP